jgi:signal transduction histidine kinase
MFQENQWPFVPVCLSDIIDPETLAVIEAGCCERIGRALTILDYDPTMQSFGHRIESVNIRQRWDPFCALLRNGERVHEADAACRDCDLQEARISLEKFRVDDSLFRRFPCHMGLHDTTYVVRLRGYPVALLYTGQYCPPEGAFSVQQNVAGLSTGRHAQIRLGEDVRQELMERAKHLQPIPASFHDALRREAEHIQRIAEAEYEKGRYRWQQAFLDSLRVPPALNGSISLEQLRRNVRDLLVRVQKFCRCQYAVFFASLQEEDTVLAPIAGCGLPRTIEERLPHFNWKKAGLPLEAFDPQTWNIPEWSQKAGAVSIRGDNAAYFASAGCVIPTTLSHRYRGIMVLGAFAEQVNLAEEQRFLVEIADAIGAFALTDLEVRYLEQERKRWRSTAMLLTHQLRTALTPITTQIGRAKALASKLSRDNNSGRIIDLLKRAEDLSLNLAESARQTLAGHVLAVEAEDLEFERYPLSVLLENCVNGFVPEAEKKHRHLILDRGVEMLPDADIDVARLTIAISNLIENALKYSYPNTTIYVRASVNFLTSMDWANAIIEIDDIGDAIHYSDRERIFEQGERALTEAKLGRIPGTGLGLWEARAVIEAHGGDIGVTCEPTAIQRAQGAAYHVIFTLRIPLRRPGNKGRS